MPAQTATPSKVIPKVGPNHSPVEGLFATTPGGSRISYTSDALMNLRSPLTRTPPPGLPEIPGVTKGCKPALRARVGSLAELGPDLDFENSSSSEEEIFQFDD